MSAATPIPENHERSLYMYTSSESALLILGKWKGESTPVTASFRSGGNSSVVEGIIAELSSDSISISCSHSNRVLGAIVLSLRDATGFDYTEGRAAPPDMQRAKDVDSVLTIGFVNGISVIFTKIST